MTQDEIIRMAREAGLTTHGNNHWSVSTTVELTRFAALVAAHEANKWKAENKRDYENWKMAAEKAAKCERELCAKVCEPVEGSAYELGVYKTMQTLAAAIRARGEK